MNRNSLFFVIFFTALILSYYQTLRIDAPNYDQKFARHDSIVSNTIGYPYKYRVLNPYIANISFSVFKMVLPEKAPFLLAYFIENILVYSFLLFAFFKFLGLFFDDTGTAIGLLLFAMLVPLSLTWWDNLGDMTTAGMMSLGFYFINSNKVKYLYPIIFIGAFNELQIVLLILFYFFSKRSNLTNKKVWINCIALTALFFAAYYIIYLIRGGQAGTGDFKWYFTKDLPFNISKKDWIILWVIMITPYIFFAAKDFKTKPEFLRRNAVIVLPVFYFAVFFSWQDFVKLIKL